MRTWEFLAPPPTKLVPARPPLSPTLPRSSFYAYNTNQSATDFDFDPRKLLRRRSSLVVADLPTREHALNILAASQGSLPEASSESEGEEKKDNKDRDEKVPDKKEEKKPPPTQFQEPDANSLLDAFGF